MTVAGITFDVVDVPGHSVAHIALPPRRRALRRRPAVRGLGRPRRSRGRRLGDAARFGSAPARALPARDGRLPRARPGDHARTRARSQSVSERAARRAARRVSHKFQAPRGTHDVLPSDATWWHLVRTIEELTRRYGYGRIQTPGFEDTALFARTAGEASDVVHKEMYTFNDRSDRSLTLRPEGTAPIARAYVEHGLHREPQPVKAYTIAPMYRYGAPGRGRYREHWQLSRRGDRVRRPGRRRRGHPVLPRAAAAPRRDEVRAAAELDRRRDLPSGLRRAASPRGSTHTPTCSTRRLATSARRARCRSST